MGPESAFTSFIRPENLPARRAKSWAPPLEPVHRCSLAVAQDRRPILPPVPLGDLDRNIGIGLLVAAGDPVDGGGCVCLSKPLTQQRPA